MGWKRDSTDSEKSKIVRKTKKNLSKRCNTLETAVILGRDHRTIKRFITKKKEMRLEKKDPNELPVKREATRN